MEQHEVALRAEIARIDAELTRRQEAERQLDALRRQAAADRTALEEAMARQRVQAGRADVLQPDAEVISIAEPPVRPFFPNPRFMAVGAAMMAVLLSTVSLLPALRRLRQSAAKPHTIGWGTTE
jgi:uncharacterized protein involved in exopolysaccharide biosynthesis